MLSRFNQRPVNGRGQWISETAVLAVVFGLLLSTSGGCSRKREVTTRTAELERAFPGVEAAIATAVPGGEPPANGIALVKAALAAARAEDYVTSVEALQEVTQISGVTPDQLIAVQGARQAMVSELVNRAASGDAAAKAALAAIEKTRSQ